jgi:RimJ/RimL family protein N-acetyltransferase
MIGGPRVRLWALEKFDVSKNYHWGNDAELMVLTGMSPYPKSLLDIERWYESVHSNPNLKLFTIKTIEGEYLGNIEINDIDWRVGRGELGIIIGEKTFWKQGIGAEAIGLLVDFAFTEMRLHRIEARVLAHNKRAQKVFERCGFSREGTMRDAFYLDGRYHDVVLYAILSSDQRTRYSRFEAVMANEKDTQKKDSK